MRIFHGNTYEEWGGWGLHLFGAAMQDGGEAERFRGVPWNTLAPG